MSEPKEDVIDRLVGVDRGGRLEGIRALRPEARANAQKSYLALFAPEFPGGVSAQERYAIAMFVAGVHRDAAILAFYRDGLVRQSGRSDVAAAVAEEIERGAAEGPYGRYPRGPLSAEDRLGPIHRVSGSNRLVLGERLCAGLEHAHLLVFRPRDASPAALQSLLDSGWSTTDIVTLSQLVAFLSFQIRVIVGLRALALAAVATSNSNV
ncbi:MAG: CMD domain protein [Roseiarcus sp.]